MVKNAPTFSEVAQEIFALLQGHIFVAHNVRFDYNFVKASFKTIGMRYSSPHLCTVELSRTVFPNLPSYSLGKLCKSLGVELKDRHRAFGDTEATTILFGKIWGKQPEKVIEEIKSDEIVLENFPEKFNIDALDEAPESKGVFILKNEDGQIIYVSKSKNIRNSILSFFKVSFEIQTHPISLHTRSFEYVEMPSDLSSQILETQLIFQYKPVHNKFIKTPKYRYGLYLKKDEQGYESFTVLDISKQKDAPMQRFSSVNKGNKLIQNLHHRLQLNASHKQVFNSEKYNQLLKSSLKYISYPYRHCWIVEENAFLEKSVVYVVKNFVFIGYAVVQDVKHTDFDLMDTLFQQVQETTEIRRGLLQIIHQKKSHIEIIDLGDSE